MLLTRKKLPGMVLVAASVLWVAAATPGMAQQRWQGGPHGPSQMRPCGAPMEHSFRGGAHGRWWDKPEVAQKIGLTSAQQKQMDGIFLKHRLQLVDLHAALQKDEIEMHSMMHADQMDQADENRILSQIDTIAQARANLEKANARMLFKLRTVLTQDQWTKLKALAEQHRKWMETHQWNRRQHWSGPNHHGGNPPPMPPPPPDQAHP